MILCFVGPSTGPTIITYEAIPTANPSSQQNGWYTRVGAWVDTDPYGAREYYLVVDGVVIYNDANVTFPYPYELPLTIGNKTYTPGVLRGQTYGWSGDVCNAFDIVVTTN